LRHFFRRSIPEFAKILLVESGSRSIFDQLIPRLYIIFGEQLEIDLVTCFAGEPAGFRGAVYRVTDYAGPALRKKLYTERLVSPWSRRGWFCLRERTVPAGGRSGQSARRAGLQPPANALCALRRPGTESNRRRRPFSTGLVRSAERQIGDSIPPLFSL